jgi:two-component system nitrate/nitrite response regulator NarL
MRRCLVADDHPGVLLALASSLRDSGFAVVTAQDGPGAVRLAREQLPDCAVIDYKMPGLRGPELLEGVRAASPGTAIVVYTAEAFATLYDEAVAAGAAAIVLKESPLGDVLRALESAIAGRQYIDPSLARKPAPWAVALSPREEQVLELVAEGLEYAEIGRQLWIGVETARTHVKKACLRLGAATRTEAVATALRQGWIR